MAVAVIVVVVAALIVSELVAGMIRWDRYRPLVESKLEEFTGLEVEIRGALDLEILPRPHFAATEVVALDPVDPAGPPLLKAGSIEMTFGWRELLLGTPQVRRVTALDAELRLRPRAEGPAVFRQLERMGEDAEERGGQLEIREVRLRNLAVFYSDRSGTVTSARFALLAAAAEDWGEPVELVARGDFEGGSFDVRGTLGPLSELARPTRPYAISLAGRILESEVSVDGTLATPSKLRGIDLAVSATLPDLAALAPERGRVPPPTGPLLLRARVTDPDGKLAIDELSVTTTRAEAVRLELTGSVRDAVAFQNVDLELRIEADSTSLLDSFLEWRVPDVGPFRALAHIEDGDGSLGLEGELHAGREQVLTIDMHLVYDDLREAAEIDADVRIWSRDLSTIAAPLNLEPPLPALGPVSASGKLVDRDGLLGVEQLQVQLGSREDTWAEVTGSIRDLVGLSGVELAAEFGASDLSYASPYVNGELPDLGPMRGVATLSDSDGTLGVEHFRLQGGREGLFELDLSGAFDDVRKIDALTFQAELSARDLGVLGNLFGADLPAVGPVEFSGWIRGSERRVVSEGQARLDQTRFSAAWSGEFPLNGRPSLRARITSPHVHLDDIGLAPEYADELPLPAKSQQADSAPFLEPLRSFDADVALSAERVTGRLGLDFRELETSIRLHDGRLVIDLLGSSDGGRLRADLEVDARTPETELALRAEIGGMDLTRLAAQFQEESQAAGLLDLSANLRTRGRTQSELRSNLSGHFQAMLRDGALASEYARRLVRNFVSLTFPTLFVEDAAPVTCARIELEIDGGVASTQTLLIDAPNVTLTGEGQIDIGTNTLDMRLTPRARDPGLLSMAVAVNLTGPITRPSYSPVRRTIATSLARGVIRNAMRPANRVLQPLRGKPETEDVCAQPLFRAYAAGD